VQKQEKQSGRKYRIYLSCLSNQRKITKLKNHKIVAD